MNPKEFRKQGFLQELNRCFLHPLGLALEMVIEDDGFEKFGEVWDCRHQAEGIYYDLENSDQERLKNFNEKCDYVTDEFNKHSDTRVKMFGTEVEPIKILKNE